MNRSTAHASEGRSPALALAAPALACGALLGVAAECMADVPVRILLKDGVWFEGRLASADAEAWRVVAPGPGKEARAIPASDIVAFLSSGTAGETPAPAPLSAGMLELTTGERLPGSLRSGTQGGNLWDHRWIGAVPVALEDMASLRIRGPLVPERKPDGDTVLLLNGDTISGFVESIGENIVCETGAAGEADSMEKRTIAMDRAAAIAFALSEPVPAQGSRFWTMDGSVVDGIDLRYDEADGWGFTLANPRLAEARGKRTSDNNAANPVAAIFASAMMTPVAAFGRPTVSVPAGQYHYGFEDAVRTSPEHRAMLGLAPIELDGPLVARFTVPAAARKGVDACIFSCEIALREPSPADARIDVEIRLGEASSGRIRLDASKTRETVRIETGATAAEHLTVILEDGGNGVVGDSIELRRANIISVRR